jgi:hypothetical protein
MENKKEKQVLKKRSKDAECSGKIMYLCIKMEKWDLLKLFQKLGQGRLKKNDEEGKFTYDILKELL